MFSFFKKKQPFSVRIKEYGSVRLIAGMEITTCRKSMKKDVSQLQKKVQQHQSELRELSNPSGTMVISTTPDETGNFSYFLGAWVDIEEQEPPRIISLKVNNSDISRLRDARDTIAVGQQGQVLYLLVEP